MNSLLNVPFRVPFDQIEAKDVGPAVDALLVEAKQRIADLARDDFGPRTFANTLEELDRASQGLDRALAVVRHLENVATTPELRAAYNEVEPKAMEFYSSIPLNDGLWRAVQAVEAAHEMLDPTRRRFLKKTYDGFRRAGAELSAEGKKELQELDIELSKITTKFGENVLDATNEFESYIETESGLAGLPPSAVAAARQSAEKKGKPGWRFTLQGPSYTAVMTYLNDAKVREQFYRAYMRRATAEPRDNTPLLQKILDLRKKKAQMLGYFNFADLTLEERMAKRGERAHEFLMELAEYSLSQFEKENRELTHFRKKLEGEMAPELEPWDVGYYAEKQRQAEYDFDEEALRPYFPLDAVVTGLFQLTERLFSFRVAEKPGVPVWDPAVKCYDVLDRDGTQLGSFYSDWFPRENKRGGAWMDSLRTGGPTPTGFEPHLGIVCGNLTPPIGDQPALLTHREVETIFHEFGHLIHHCLSKVEIRSLAGTNVAWDFVELPSQIMENWCWEKEALDLFARHYQTHETIPMDLFGKMKRARTFRAANAQMRQIGFGVVDLRLHMLFDAKRYRDETGGDVLAYAREVLQSYSATTLPSDHAMIAAFTHLFASPVGYGAGYYSYKWAELLDADAFSRFRSEGVFNPQTGREFREWILERGDSEDPSDLFRGFMGREPDHRALLERQGLLAVQ